MKINLITLFPEFFDSPLSTGLMQRAVKNDVVNFALHNPRDYTDDKRQTVDDRPYGGGPGMVMLLEPLVRSLRAIGHSSHRLGSEAEETPKKSGRILYMSPKGRPLTQALARELAEEKEMTILCGRYEGIDARLNELFAIEEVSMGDFVLNGGETAALAVCEAVCRLLPGFMGHEESGQEESFSAGLLEYPHYTRPENYHGLEVPEVLRSGDHAKIARWRRDEALSATLRLRPKMLETARLEQDDMHYVRSKSRELAGRNLYVALIHYPVLDRDKKSVSVALTNLDIHDIARSSCTYGLGGYFVVTPLEDQRLILEEVLEHWVSGPGAKSNPDRKNALSKVVPAANLDEAAAWVEKKHGVAPLLWGSSAQGTGTITFDEAQKLLYTRPAILLLGTGHGLAPEVASKCDSSLPPLRWAAPYNHLSVRSAGVLLMDRILGEWG